MLTNKHAALHGRKRKMLSLMIQKRSVAVMDVRLKAGMT